MNHQSLYHSINQAVSSYTTRDWTANEVIFIRSNLELQAELIEWLENPFSDECWTSENYNIIKTMSRSSRARSSASFNKSTSLNDISDEVDIPF